jgi:hypothetical protein
MVRAAGVAPALATFSTSFDACKRPLHWATRTKWMEPPAGAAPAGSLYKNNPQTAAWRRKWSQSPVLPRTQRAYETHLSTGPTAVLADGQEWSPHPLARPHSAVEPHPQRGQAEGRMTDAETNQPSPFYILHLPFFLREVAECRGLAPLARRHALFSKQARHA